jgi:hypothetical protein
MDQALVYTGIQSGLKTGVGYYVVLAKEKIPGQLNTRLKFGYPD